MTLEGIETEFRNFKKRQACSRLHRALFDITVPSSTKCLNRAFLMCDSKLPSNWCIEFWSIEVSD